MIIEKKINSFIICFTVFSGDNGNLQWELHLFVCCIQKHIPHLGVRRILLSRFAQPKLGKITNSMNKCTTIINFASLCFIVDWYAWYKSKSCLTNSHYSICVAHIDATDHEGMTVCIRLIHILSNLVTHMFQLIC